MDQQHEYDVILTPASEGGYVVSVPELPDVHTEGETREEAVAMLKAPSKATLRPCATVAGHRSQLSTSASPSPHRERQARGGQTQAARPRPRTRRLAA